MAKEWAAGEWVDRWWAVTRPTQLRSDVISVEIEHFEWEVLRYILPFSSCGLSVSSLVSGKALWRSVNNDHRIAIISLSPNDFIFL